MEMPDVLSAHILEFVRERLRRNWPLVLAFEIRTGRVVLPNSAALRYEI
jgi:hypothetical protein